MISESSDYIIWIGSVFSEQLVLEKGSISPAGNKWQLNFINALYLSGNKVINVGHCPERVFPFGKLFVNKRDNISPDTINLYSSSYFNLPGLRILFLNILYTIRLITILNKHRDRTAYIVGYNAYRYNIAPLLFARYIKKIKWISIVADPMYNSSNIINPFNSLADARVFLSYELFKRNKSNKKIHLDGGIKLVVELNRDLLKKKERIILYTGLIAYHTGIELLIKAFSLSKLDNFRLIICGKGNNELLNNTLSINKRITFLGMVSEQDLLSLYSEAFLFINPRLIGEKSNESNFPSKLLDYLSYSKPIISTYTSGINPLYKEVIQFVYSDDPVELASKIDEIGSWNDEHYINNSGKIREFVEKNKKWSKVIVDFTKWANNDFTN
jgi:glycosyltransferase involved in cell wall biosynthesis